MPIRQSNGCSILLIIDALRPDMLGPYGNTWFDTPAFNRLACESILFEQCVADSPDPEKGLTSLITGQHFCRHIQKEEQHHSLMDAIGDAAESILVTTDTECLPELYDQFDSVVEVKLPQVQRLVADLETTQLATFIASAIQAIDQVQSNTFLVLYCGSLGQAWDAPMEFRMQLADEDDPAPTDNCVAVNQQFNVAVDDPDQLLDSQIGYASQILMLDQMLGILMQQISENSVTREALFCLTALRGYPLGEHGVVGFYRQQLFNDSLHVPLMIRMPGSKSFGRSQRLVQPGSVFELISDWHGKPQPCVFPDTTLNSLQPDVKHSAVVSGMTDEDSASAYSIQTHGWKLVTGNSKQLFVRPDDLWEYNDVANLCPDVVTALESQLQDSIDQLALGKKPELDLAAELAFGIE